MLNDGFNQFVVTQNKDADVLLAVAINADIDRRCQTLEAPETTVDRFPAGIIGEGGAMPSAAANYKHAALTS